MPRFKQHSDRQSCCVLDLPSDIDIRRLCLMNRRTTGIEERDASDHAIAQSEEIIKRAAERPTTPATFLVEQHFAKLRVHSIERLLSGCIVDSLLMVNALVMVDLHIVQLYDHGVLHKAVSTSKICSRMSNALPVLRLVKKPRGRLRCQSFGLPLMLSQPFSRSCPAWH